MEGEAGDASGKARDAGCHGSCFAAPSSLFFPLFFIKVFIPHPDPPCVFCISFTQCSRLASFPKFTLPVLTACTPLSVLLCLIPNWMERIIRTQIVFIYCKILLEPPHLYISGVDL